MSILLLLDGPSSLAPPPSGDGSLADVIASAVFDLDATIAASYPGTGTTWSNLVTAPADGSAQTAYDFLTGDGATSTTYPTFNGSAGSAAAYWGFDGGDYFLLKSGVNTNFLRDLQKTTGGSDWWFAATIKVQAGTIIQGLFGNRTTTSTSIGVAVWLTASEFLQAPQSNGTQVVASRTGAFVDDNIYVVLVSHSHSTNATRFWVNSVTAQEVSQTYNTTTTDAARVARLFGISGSGGQGPLNLGTETYSAAMGNEYLDDTKAAAIIAALEARHGRDYTP